MTATASRPSELALPVPALAALRSALAEVVGTEAAAHALRQAGYAAGGALHDILAGDTSASGGLPAERFWARVARLFASRGWGHLRHSEVHEGVGALDATDWVEARTDAAAAQPSCHFSTGVIASLLGRAADADVAVLEVECRSRGDARCRFLFGGEPALQAVYQRLADGAAPEAALTQLR